MATLTNTKIKDTYQSLLKTTNNTPVSATNQYLTDGFGNATPLSVGTNNIGIGTILPAFKLHVANNDNAYNGQFVIQNTNGGSNAIAQMLFQTNSFGYGLQIRSFNSDGKVEIVNTSNSHTSLWTNNIERLRITSTGNVGINTTNPGFKLDVNGTFRVTGASYFGTSTNLAANTYTNGTLTFRGDYDDVRMIAQSSGYGGITWNTSSGDSMHLDGDMGYLGLGGVTSPSYQLELGTNSAAKPVSSLWTLVSDLRVKENIRDYTKGLNEVLQIEPKLFDYNGKAGFDKTKDNIGIIAQDMINILPETINTYKTKLNEDDAEKTELYNYDGHALTFALVNSIKELQQQINDLKTEIEILKKL